MPDYPPGKQCNAKGLTALGAYLVRRMIGQAHADRGRPHERAGARDRVLKIAEAADYPLVSSHTGHRRDWTPTRAAHACTAVGGFADRARPGTASSRRQDPRSFRRTAARATTSASASAPTRAASRRCPARAPTPRSDPLAYPFNVLRREGHASPASAPASASSTSTPTASPTTACSPTCSPTAAHAPRPRGDAVLFRSAEAYLQTWQRAFTRSDLADLHHRSRVRVVGDVAEDLPGVGAEGAVERVDGVEGQVGDRHVRRRRIRLSAGDPLVDLPLAQRVAAAIGDERHVGAEEVVVVERVPVGVRVEN